MKHALLLQIEISCLFLQRLTSKEAQHFLSTIIIGHASPCGTHVGPHGGEWQEVTAIVCIVIIHPQQSLISSEVSETASFAVIRTIDLTHIDEGRQSVHLLADSG